MGITFVPRMSAETGATPEEVARAFLVARDVRPDSDQARWLTTAKAGSDQIRDIVKRMNQITTLQEVPRQGALPPMLDIRRSAEKAGEEVAN